jgi:hypothetical protein
MTLLDDRPITAALAGVLDGHRSLPALMRRLRGPERDWFLLCLGARTVATVTPRAAAVCPDAVVVAGTEADSVFVLAPYRSAERAGALAGRLSRVLPPGQLTVCWSDPVHDETDPVALARALRRAVSLLSGTQRTASLAQLRPRLVLAELAELGAGLPVGPAEKLLAHDRDRRTQLVPTLAAYFDAGGDMTEAAKRLYLHRNTLRYRLTQAERICGVSLRSPLERFVLELEVRLVCAATD